MLGDLVPKENRVGGVWGLQTEGFNNNELWEDRHPRNKGLPGHSGVSYVFYTLDIGQFWFPAIPPHQHLNKELPHEFSPTSISGGTRNQSTVGLLEGISPHAFIRDERKEMFRNSMHL